MKRRILYIAYYIAAATLGLLPGGLTRPAPAQTRFDHVVRNDFFAGMMGNTEALDRGMSTCEKILAEDPNHAEALVWHGVGLFFRSSQHFRQGERDKGIELYTKGMAEMDRAVELAPDHIGVRIPRGAALLSAARNMGPQAPIVGELYKRALSDHERAYSLQRDMLDKMGTHPRGELLLALADIHSRQGNAAKADEFFNLILEKVPDSPYAKRAAMWKETRKPLPANQAGCIGCHTK